MNFTEVLRTSIGQLSWSPDGQFCAVPVTARLEVRDATSLNTVVTFSCVDVVQVVEWAPDSCYLLSASYKRGVVEVWSVNDPDWRCKIDEGSAGLIKVCWAPDSRHILTTAEFYLRVTVWSLVNKTVSYITNPKNMIGGLQLSPDHEYLAVAERRDCKDSISLFETTSWQFVKNFEVATKDLAGLRWSNDGSVLAVWESPLEYKMFIYSLSGQCLATYSAYQWSLGIKSVAWSPSSQFLAIGSYDNKVRLMNHISWRITAEFPHTTILNSASTAVYNEKEKPLTGYPATLASVQGLPLVVETAYEEETRRPLELARVSVAAVKGATARLGIGTVQWSRDGRWLATRREDMPATLWVWSIPKLSLSVVLLHANSIKDFAWDQKQTRLAVCTSSCHVYFWSPFGCLTVTVPSAPLLQISSLRWHPKGQSLALVGRDQFSVCFLNKNRSLMQYTDDDET
ncbi:hypothetical protein Pmani_011763 [Petrolisthes manimaculis]|uniref:WD repeat-containing protein WRAP73 n=1 Tax=Petrolisthes manimaculis TaxID=1843537 RepID=A0AAE1Q0G2_9EUCA|nr:hypothetical protein Pmani_011763 [Petrolisthes manimaculis]